MEVIGKASLAMGAMAADTVDLFGKKKVVVVTSTRGCPRLTPRVARRCAVLRHVAQAQRRTPSAETMSPASPAPEETPRPVRFGIVGCANIARKLSRAMLLVPSAAEVAAVGSRSEGKARRFAADNGLPAGTRLHGSYEALLDDPDVDAVYLPLPTSLHLKWATAAAARGKHVLLEKPTALCAADLDAILAACEASGVQFMDCTMWVHNPRTAKMRELVADQATIGDVRVVLPRISLGSSSCDF